MLQNLSFTGNAYDNITDRRYETRPVTDHLNSKFTKDLSNAKKQIHQSKMTFKTAHVWNSTLNLSQFDGFSNFGLGSLINHDICIKWVFTHTRNRPLNLI